MCPSLVRVKDVCYEEGETGCKRAAASACVDKPILSSSIDLTNLVDQVEITGIGGRLRIPCFALDLSKVFDSACLLAG